MSRCFPFPPPGYEKKIPTTQLDLLKKEKHREKKHKKEKKDKEKKDRGKKDKKEKRRDKKKEKERDKDQQLDNLNTSAETRLKVRPQGHSGQNGIHKDSDTYTLPDVDMILGRNAGYNERYHGQFVSLAKEPNGTEFVHSAEKTLRDDAERGGSNIMQEKITSTPQKRYEGGGKLYHNSHLGNKFEDPYLALELDRRLRNEAEQPYDQSQTAKKPIVANQKRDGGAVKSVPSGTMEKGNIKMVGSNGRYIGYKSAEATLVRNTCGLGQGKHAKMPRSSLDSDIEKKIQGQETINHLEDKLLQQGKKRKDKERNGDRKSPEKHKRREKEKMEDNSNSRIDQKSAEQGTLVGHKMDILTPPNMEMFHRGKYNVSSTSNNVNMNQEKGILTNGAAHVTGPSVLSRPSSLHNENGREPEQYPILAKPTTGGPGPSKIGKAGKPNGTIRPATEQVVQARPRSPHPDTKRLTDILVIPKIEELSEIDDSDWLTSSKEGPGKKHNLDDYRVTTIANTPPVWSKATSIDSADVCALPYVIPY